MYPGVHAQTHPDRPAVIQAETGAVTTYGQLHERAIRLSNVLRAAGVRPGDHVALCLENHPRFLEVIWGCHYAGSIYTACSSRLTRAELSYILNDCEAKVFITSKYKAEQALEIAGDIPNVTTRLMLDAAVEGYDSYESVVEAASTTPLEGMVDGTDMLYSSGTTGMPKGVARVFAGTPLGDAAGLGAPLTAGLYKFHEEMRYLSPAPLYHAAPLRFNMSVHAHGGTTVVMEHFDAQRYLEFVEKFRITHSQLVPTMFIRMLKLDDDIRLGYDVGSLEVVIHAAAPCPVETKRAMIQWWGPIIHEYYAGTEGNGFVYCNSDMWLAHPGTVGMALNATVHILDEEGNEVPVGESGTIYFEGGNTFEYHNDPEKTRASRDPRGRGWSTLGDVGFLDGDGFLYLTDRKAFMIISGGVNIYPQEAENCLVNHPKVVDVAVFGVPNDDFGEEVKAVVQPKTMPSDASEAAALEKELIVHCKSQLADIKCPRSIDFRPDLPRHPTGKLYKRLLKDEYWKAAGRSI
ncbi:MAG: AMP-binding protein [Actinobacteria bacterium]|nr:AMP-binding protein [Actinomycetota bacterium]